MKDWSHQEHNETTLEIHRLTQNPEDEDETGPSASIEITVPAEEQQL